LQPAFCRQIVGHEAHAITFAWQAVLELVGKHLIPAEKLAATMGYLKGGGVTYLERLLDTLDDRARSEEHCLTTYLLALRPKKENVNVLHAASVLHHCSDDLPCIDGAEASFNWQSGADWSFNWLS